MDLDRTRIAVREREMAEILDLSLRVLRFYFQPLVVCYAVAVVPLMALNWMLLGWMAEEVWQDQQFPYRFLWNMTLLVFTEAPLASVFATAYIGQAVFLDRPRIRDVIGDVFRLSPRIVWCLMIQWCIVPLWALYLLLDRRGDTTVVLEALVIPVMVLIVWVNRASRPFLPEIIVLEKNPLRAAKRTKNEVERPVSTIRERNRSLHRGRGGDLLLRSTACIGVAIALWTACYGTILFCSGVLLEDWRQGPLMTGLFWPLSMWVVGLYLTVVRFLNYLDSRIRQEGWEVELRLRAEATKLAGQLG